MCPSSSSKKVNSQQFAKYFKAINDPESSFFQAVEDVLYYTERYVKGELEVMFQELNVRISLSEIRKGIRLLKNGKSSGPDLLLNELIKYSNDDLLQYLHGLFNKIFDIGYFPDSLGGGGWLHCSIT